MIKIVAEGIAKGIGILIGFLILIYIGILIIGGPRMFRGQKARQSEPKTNLASIATASISYYADKRIWGESFKIIGWEPYGKVKFTYFLTPTDYLGTPPGEFGIKLPLDYSFFGAPIPGVSADGFTAVAIGNIDKDKTLDVWWIDQAKDPHNSQNDVNQ